MNNMRRLVDLVDNTLNEGVTDIFRKKIKHPELNEELSSYINNKIDSKNFEGEYDDKNKFIRLIRKLGFTKIDKEIYQMFIVQNVGIPTIRYFHIHVKEENKFTLNVETIEIF